MKSEIQQQYHDRIGLENVYKLKPYFIKYTKRMISNLNYRINFNNMRILENGDIIFIDKNNNLSEEMSLNFAICCSSCISERIVLKKGHIKFKPLEFKYDIKEKKVIIILKNITSEIYKKRLMIQIMDILRNPFKYGYATD